MSTTSNSPSSPEVITLDESVPEVVELDRSESNLAPLESVIDVPNESLPAGNEAIKIFDADAISVITEKKNTSLSTEAPKNEEKDQNIQLSEKNKLLDQNSDSVVRNEKDDFDSESTLKNEERNPSLESTIKNDNQSEKLSEKNKNQDIKLKPLVKIEFSDSELFEKNCKKIESFMKILLIPDLGRNNFQCTVKDSILEIFESNKSSHKSSSISLKRPIGKELSTSSNDALFTIDLAPQLPDDIDIPKYGKKFKKALEKPKEDKADDAKNDGCPKLTCFNCLGNHNLRDCDQPRNYGAINKNRKEFASKRGPTASRYHLEDDQKYDHFFPGQISDNLRKALGLKENSLPKHIYRMRRIGYPPGWMEEARLQHSGLSLFNSEGIAEQESDEEGEIVIPGDKDRFDIKKIIDFPGFNVIPNEGTHDEEYKHYWGSLLQQNNSKEAMLSYLSSKQAEDGYKRKKMPHPANTIIRTNVNSGEMELDEVEETPVECIPTEGLFIPPLPSDENSPIPPPPPLDDSEDYERQSQAGTSTNSNDGSAPQISPQGSPSLIDLENKKTKLLAELEESQSPGVALNTDLIKTGIDTKEVSDIEKSKFLNSPRHGDLVKPNTSSNNSPKTPNNSEARKSTISVHVGTPILHSVSPFKRLPSAEKFSKDICDVINFENLPDSTGKYDQMTELLQKVRNTLHKE